MIKIGVDMLQVARIETVVAKQNEMDNIFTNTEKEYLKTKLESGEIKGYKFFECVAGMFCAKEAVLKALGVGIVGVNSLKQVEVNHKENGEPFVKLVGNLEKVYKDMMNTQNVCVSISHDGGMAFCSAVVELNNI